MELGLRDMQNVKILNSHFGIHKFTQYQTTRQLQSIRDYIIISQTSIMNIQDIQEYGSIECGTEHHFLKMMLYLTYMRVSNHQEQKRNNNKT